MKQKYQILINNFKSFIRDNNIRSWVLGLSWWVDSALTLAIWVEVLWKNNIKALLMPDDQHSSDDNFNDAKVFAEELLNVHIKDRINKKLLVEEIIPIEKEYPFPKKNPIIPAPNNDTKPIITTIIIGITPLLLEKHSLLNQNEKNLNPILFRIE